MSGATTHPPHPPHAPPPRPVASVRRDAPRPLPARSPWRFLRHDIGRKLTALVLALMLWFYLFEMVSGERTMMLDVRIESSRQQAQLAATGSPAVYLVVPDDLIVRKTTPKVEVYVAGPQDAVDELELSAIVEVAPDDLGDEDEAAVVKPLERSLFKSRGAEPKLTEFKLKPGALRLVLARRAEAEFLLGPPNVSPVGRPREGYSFDESRIRVHPNRVTVSGPRSAIEQLQADPTQLKLSPVDLEGRLFEVSQQVGLDPERVDRSVTLHTAGNVVEVTIPIAPKEATRELLAVPVDYEHGDILTVERKKLVFATESLDLEVRGPRSVLDTRTNEQLRSSIRLVYDWADSPVSPRLPQARARVRVLRDLELPDEIKIVGLDGRHPEIEYRLEDLEPATPPAPANKDGSP